jgi:DNA-binding transcriptional MerR regulator
MPDLMNRQPAAQPPIDPQKLAIIQLLLQQGVPIEQVATILNAQPQSQQPPVAQQYPLSPRSRRRDSRSRSPPQRRRSPSRSISPPPRGRGRGRRRDSFDSPPPRRRRSPSYDDYRRRSPSRSRSPPANFRRNSPPPRKASPIRKPPPITELKELKPRFIEYDESLKPDRIRGISIAKF